MSKGLEDYKEFIIPDAVSRKLEDLKSNKEKNLKRAFNAGLNF